MKLGRFILARSANNTSTQNELVTVPNVPMLSTGIDYPTSTGLVTLTEQHLLDVIASQDDPSIHAPRTKIGHSDPRFNMSVTPDGQVLDGEPSLGSWQNLRLGNNNQTLYGDIVGVPRWLASILATAYPSRSIEGNFDVETVTGHKWSLALEAVSLLGVIGPGITTLEDLPILFSMDGPDGVRIVEAREGDPMSVRAGSSIVAVSNTPWSNFSDSDYSDTQYASACIYDRAKCSDTWTSKPAKQRYSLPVKEPSGALNRNGCHAAASRINSVSGGCDAAKKAAATKLIGYYRNQLKEDPPQSLLDITASKIVAQVNLDDLRRSYYESLEPSQFWWWIRAIYIDPGELIVDDDEGGLYRVPFDAKNDEVTFGDPQEVQIQYVDKPKTTASASLRAALSRALGGKRVLATYSVRTESRQGDKSMDPAQIAVLRNRLGLSSEQLPDDADDATILQVLGETEEPKPEENPPPTQPENPVQNPPATPGQPTNPPAPQNPPEAPNIPEGYQVIDEATLNQLREGANAGIAVARQNQEAERDRFMDDAIRAGKFPPSRREHYVLMWSGKDGKGGDPEGTKSFIDALAPGLVPVEARGTERGVGESLEAASEYPQHWLSPAERSRIAAAGKGDNGNYGNRHVITHGGD